MSRWNPWRYLRDRHPDVHVHCTHHLVRPSLGEWDGRRLVHLDGRLQQTERRCTLAHELVHLERGPCDPEDAREEQLVHELAARLLVTLDQLVDAILWGQGQPDPDELWIDPATLLARVRALTDDERTYIDRRMEGRTA